MMIGDRFSICACLGCPLSPNTLHGWVEGTVKQFFPVIGKVESEA